jgi:hypothetical protein
MLLYAVGGVSVYWHPAKEEYTLHFKEHPHYWAEPKAVVKVPLAYFESFGISYVQLRPEVYSLDYFDNIDWSTINMRMEGRQI